ncbi:hypothetical protein FSARC_12904 [Fusarium sarcochroum]|uniref:Zn(2)-C6 fungal-type domain-containing protein n=1 Tax=Fusarium sarcochroum TaxID=1208366 RepID=A0A8H4T563_9HYPO|nr:hypothetical protein FSARC_12904 [Fusarium sarcochroum]
MSASETRPAQDGQGNTPGNIKGAQLKNLTNIRDTCRKCTRFGVPCPGYELEFGSRSEMLKSADDIFKAAGLDKRRVGSCNGCRASKSRCSRTRPTCQRCRAKNLDCIYRANAGDKDDSSVSPADHGSSRAPENTAPGLYHECLYLDSLDSASESITDLNYPIPGEAWALKARKMVFDEIHLPTVKQIMTMILLCEYGSRADQHSLVFMLGGCIYRAMRLLSLDNPRKNTQSIDQLTGDLEEEINNRIVWASYTIDILLSSGVDKNSSWREDIPQVPLPCSDKDFLLQSPSPRRFLHQSDSSATTIKELDLPALLIILAKLRGQVLRLIRSSPPSVTNIWDSSSPFMLLIGEIDKFYENLPDTFQMTELNMYIHKDQHTIGALSYLHFMYNAAIFDLTRISIAGFSFPLAAAFQHAPPDFRSQCQKRCHFHAMAVSDLIRQGFDHGRVAFDDLFCMAAALESSKIQIIYWATIANDVRSMDVTRQNLRTTLRLFDFVYATQIGRSTYIRTLLPLCVSFGFRDIAEEWRCSQTPHLIHPEVTGSAEDHHLVNLAPFRQAQTQLRAHQEASPQDASPSSVSGHRTTLNPNEERPPILSVEGAAFQIPPGQQLHPETRFDSIAVQGQESAVMPQGMDTTDVEMTHPSVEDYIRIASDMSEYLTWDLSELPDLPLWEDFEDQNTSLT